MNITLWIIQILLAIIFLMGGTMKLLAYEKFKAGFEGKAPSKGLITFIGLSELLGAIGLILPYALSIVPVLTPIAAIGIGIIMVLAAIVNAKNQQYKKIGINIVILALALFVAIGRM